MASCIKGVRSALKRHGGKGMIAGWIAGHLPSHRRYVEPFFGAGSVLLTKKKVGLEIASDLDPRLVNFWRVLRDRCDFIANMATCIDYGEFAFSDACEYIDQGCCEIQALWYFVRNRMSRSGLGIDFARPGTNPDGSPRLRGGLPDNENAWRTAVAELPRICDRIQGVEFLCEDAISVIRGCDDPNTLIYVDSPYMLETRTAWDCYEFEVTDRREGESKADRIARDRAWHMTLLGALLKSRSKFVISGYRSDLYDSALKDCERVDFGIANHSGQGKAKGRRVESIWIKA